MKNTSIIFVAAIISSFQTTVWNVESFQLPKFNPAAIRYSRNQSHREINMVIY